MSSLLDAVPSEAQRVLIYGPPKTGKTEFASKAALEYDVYHFDLENGWSVYKKLPLEAQKRVQLYRLPDTRTFPVGIETVLKLCKLSADVRFCKEHGVVNCTKCAKEKPTEFEVVNIHALGPESVVVIDSLTQLTESAIASITKGKADDYKLDYDDWGNLGKLMGIVLSCIQQLNCHVICISHEMEVELEDDTKKLVPVSGTRNFSRNTAKSFDHVIYAQIKNGKHVFSSSTTASGRICAGSRSDIALEKEELPSILPILRGQLGVPKGAVTQGHSAVAGIAKYAANAQKPQGGN